jgi:hypothetical protein
LLVSARPFSDEEAARLEQRLRRVGTSTAPQSAPARWRARSQPLPRTHRGIAQLRCARHDAGRARLQGSRAQSPPPSRSSAPT